MTDQQGAFAHRVSRRGQLLLPAAARRRWGIVDGGEVEVFDLGDAVIVLQGPAGSARKALAAARNAERYNEYIAQIEDPDLQDQ